MKLYSKLCLTALLCASAVSFNAFGSEKKDARALDSKEETYAKECRDFYAKDTVGKEFPGMENVREAVEFDGIKVTDFCFKDKQKYIRVSPEEQFKAHMHYEFNADALSSAHLYHLMIGYQNQGPLGCILHSFGINDAEGNKNITLKAPKEPGVYPICLSHTVGLKATEAKNAWLHGHTPSDKTVVGIVVVE